MSASKIPHEDFWDRFVTDTEIEAASSRYFDTMRFSYEDPSDDNVVLVLTGAKTATSELRAEMNGHLPDEGSLSIVEDLTGQPVAVIERTEVTVAKFSDIDDAFARAYGDWGGSLKSWRRQCRATFAPRCRALGQPFGEQTELVCMRFRVVYDPAMTAQRRKGKR